jgi:hypothetical protein
LTALELSNFAVQEETSTLIKMSLDPPLGTADSKSWVAVECKNVPSEMVQLLADSQTEIKIIWAGVAVDYLPPVVDSETSVRLPVRTPSGAPGTSADVFLLLDDEIISNVAKYQYLSDQDVASIVKEEYL